MVSSMQLMPCLAFRETGSAPSLINSTETFSFTIDQRPNLPTCNRDAVSYAYKGHPGSGPPHITDL